MFYMCGIYLLIEILLLNYIDKVWGKSIYEFSTVVLFVQ